MSVIVLPDIENNKTKVCKSVILGVACPHGVECRFAHSVTELKEKQCVYGDECKFVQNINDKYINIKDKICDHMHPNETFENYYERMSEDYHNSYKFIKRESKQVEVRSKAFEILKDKSKIDNFLKKTKFCIHKNCKRGSSCRFAHNKNELLLTNCVFGNSCKFVKEDGNRFINISKTKICYHKHPDESLDNFYKRVAN